MAQHDWMDRPVLGRHLSMSYSETEASRSNNPIALIDILTIHPNADISVNFPCAVQSVSVSHTAKEVSSIEVGSIEAVHQVQSLARSVEQQLSPPGTFRGDHQHLVPFS